VHLEADHAAAGDFWIIDIDTALALMAVRTLPPTATIS